MPQVHLEYSSNLSASADLKAFFTSLHELLVERAQARLEDCKSRASELDCYLVGDGSSPAAFVFLKISLLEGRSPELREEIGQAAIRLLQTSYRQAQKQWDLQIRVQVKEMDPTFYFSA